MALELTGLEGKVALITGAGRMRSIGRGIAQALAEAGCDIVITGSGRDPERYPDEEKQAGWRDIESVAEEVRGMWRGVDFMLVSRRWMRQTHFRLEPHAL